MPRPTRPRRGRSRERPSIPSLPAGARSSRMQRASRRRWERRPASAIPAIHGSGAPTRTPMAFSGTGSRRARASTMSAAARCRRHAIRSAGDHASVSGGSVPGRSATASRCTCSEDSPGISQRIGKICPHTGIYPRHEQTVLRRSLTPGSALAKIESDNARTVCILPSAGVLPFCLHLPACLRLDVGCHRNASS